MKQYKIEWWNNVKGAHYSIAKKVRLEKNWEWATDLKQESQYNNKETMKPSMEAPASQAHTVILCYLEWVEKSIYLKSCTSNIPQHLRSGSMSY